MNRIIPWVFLLFQFLISCGSQKNLSTNNAYLKIIEILKMETPSESDIWFVNNNFLSVQSSLEETALDELDTESRFRWKNALTIYTRIQALNNAMDPYSDLYKMDRKDYSNQIDKIRMSAGKEILEEATEALLSGTREGAKTSFFQLLEVDELTRGMIETSTLQKEAMEIAEVEAAIFVDSINQLGLGLDSIKKNALKVLLTPGIGGPFVSFTEYNLEKEPDHLIEIKLEDYITGQIIKNSYSQQVEGLETEFQILEESIDVVFNFRIRITDIQLNRVLDNSTVKITRKLENLVGTYSADTNHLNDYQRSLLLSRPMEGHPENVLLHIQSAVIKNITDEILDFYLNY